MVLYVITISPLAEDLRDADPTLVSPFYDDYAVFDGSARWILVQLKLLMDRGPDRGYFLELFKSLFIADNLEDEEAMNQDFDRLVLNLN